MMQYRVDILIKVGNVREFIKSDEIFEYEIEALVLRDYLHKKFSHYSNSDIKIDAVIKAINPEL